MIARLASIKEEIPLGKCLNLYDARVKLIVDGDSTKGVAVHFDISVIIMQRYFQI